VKRNMDEYTKLEKTLRCVGETGKWQLTDTAEPNCWANLESKFIVRSKAHTSPTTQLEHYMSP
jgi:hypothetical protein